ncbi:BnaC02g12050D [Brassica napus]|uniref:BnaC02g12050D protein n=1 Tax=Brassica napus TaxID=3708 RepID=A0A078H4W6_BRANA|nr:BnaC02g12050D [Brassica napus]
MDRLSQLPDDLLIKILSFVPTKCAVATSILSKRWLSLWTLVPGLVFEDFSEEENEEINEIHVRSLSQFVSGTLLLHKAAVLERVHLNSATECSPWEIGLWVRIAVDRFTLETLQLRRVILSEVPCRLSFPSLTKLRLLSVKYSDDGSFSRIVSNCPILDDLVVETCHRDNVATFTVNLPSLQSLSVRNTVRESPPDDHLVVIHSQSLKQLDIVDYFGELKRIGNLPKLEHWILVDRNVRWMQPRHVPECMLLHLKTFDPTYLLHTLLCFHDDLPVVFQVEKVLSFRLWLQYLAREIKKKKQSIVMDRLSQLPDDLLIKILSFVPTKCAVATSILSKRWLSLWTLVASLVFEDFSEEEDEEINEIHVRSLSQFVSGTLLFTQSSCPRKVSSQQHRKKSFFTSCRMLLVLITAKISVYSSGHRFGEKELLRIKELESVPKASTSCQLRNRDAFRYGNIVDAPCYSKLTSTKGFSKGSFLAEGGFGSVHRGTLPGGQIIAVKQYKIASTQGDKEFCSEVEVLSCAQHRNVVMLIGLCVEDGKRLLVYEYICYGSLHSHLYGLGKEPLGWSARQKIAVGAARGLRYLHEECRVGCIVHRDMRPNNILLTHDFEPLVGDFGLARWQPEGDKGVETRVIGTFGYLAPEYTQSGQITEKADVYSFGVVLVELITGRKAMDIKRPKGQQCLTEWARPLLQKQAIKELLDPRLMNCYSEQEVYCMALCAYLCIRRDPNSRPRMSQVLRMLEGDVVMSPI